jgi:hypothetical protein
VVLIFAPSLTAHSDGHELSTLLESARRLARLKGFADGGPFDASVRYPQLRYSVPHETLASETALHLGIRSEDDLYGGSTITAVRGDYDRLLSLRLPDDIRQAIMQARIYDDAANECFDGFYASRRNYDVAREASMRRAARAPVCWNNPGVQGVRAAPRSAHWKLSATIRRYAPSVP